MLGLAKRLKTKILQASTNEVSDFAVEGARCPLTTSRRFLALVTDAFGGRGGIAKFNREFLSALCRLPRCGEVVVLPRILGGQPEPIPQKLTFRSDASGGKLRFLVRALGLILRGEKFDLVIAGHINLLPVAYVLARWFGSPLVLIVHGVDAWTPTRSRIANLIVRKVDWVVCVSQVTAERFRVWSKTSESALRILPCCIDLNQFAPGPRPRDLELRYGLSGLTVLMTVGRLSDADRYKGIDEIIEVLPALRASNPNIVYLVCGEGSDRARLEQKAKAAGLEGAVVFAGYIPESRKADYYRLADAYVMPGRGEGFGIVILEALASGIPVVGSKLDGTGEALRHGELGILVDPDNRQELTDAVTCALAKPKQVPPGLEYFSSERFQSRVAQLVQEFTKGSQA